MKSKIMDYNILKINFIDFHAYRLSISILSYVSSSLLSFFGFYFLEENVDILHFL
jgi:hypothetical protein